jgi:hypothetical protein
LAASGLAASVANAGVRWSVIARQGAPAPGAGAGVVFGNDLLPPSIDEEGRVGFHASLAGAGVTSANDYAIWYGPAASPALVAREGDPVPGLTGVRYASFGAPAYNSGKVLFTARLVGTGVTTANNLGLFLSDNGAPPVMVARTNGPAAGLTGLRYSLFTEHAINATGKLVFRGVVAGAGVNAGNDGAIWSGTVGAIELIGREGSPSGLGTDLFFGDLSTGPVNMSATGEATFISTLIGNGAGIDPTGTLWRSSSGAPTPIVRTGLQAPGTGPGTRLFDLYNPPASTSGMVAVGADLAGPNVTPFTDKGIWAGPPEDMRLVARAGSALEGGLQYQAFTTNPYLNRRGDIAFGCTLRGAGVDLSNNTAVCIGSVSYPRLVARAGAPVQSLPGVVYAPIFVSKILFNESGMAAFEWAVAGVGVDQTNDAVLQVVHESGAHMLVLREGQPFELSAGDSRTVAAFHPITSSTSQGGDGRSQGFSSSGQLSLRLDFTDGTLALAIAHVTCPSDLNADGQVDFFDYLDMVAYLAADDARADVNQDGTVDFFDYLDYVERFDEGC